MSAFLWTIAVLLVLEIVGTLYELSKGEPLPRTRATHAIDIAVGVGLVTWAVVLLAR